MNAGYPKAEVRKMVWSVKELIGYRMLSLEGDIGHVVDFYFDDHRWMIRYMVGDTGNWLPGRKVLLSPHSLGVPNRDLKRIPVTLTREKIKDSPDVDEHLPFSRQQEIELQHYYGWATYWNFGEPAPVPLPQEVTAHEEEPSFEHNLRSAEEVIGYHIEALDGEIGHLDDLLIEDNTWAIHSLVIETRNILPGKQVTVSPEWIRNVDWFDRKVMVGMVRDAVQRSPEYHPHALIEHG